MKLVEIKKTIATSKETVENCENFIKSLGKTSVITKDLAGSISNRLTTSFFLNAVRMLEANVATAEDIDTAIRLGNNHPMLGKIFIPTLSTPHLFNHGIDEVSAFMTLLR